MSAAPASTSRDATHALTLWRALGLMSFHFACGLATATVVPANAVAQWEGEAVAGGRLYAADALGLGRAEPVMSGRLRRVFKLGDSEVPFAVSARLDPADTDRNRVDIDELALLGAVGIFDVTVGIREISWGVLESRHLVDVVNQRDPERRWPRSEKLGQPMVGVSWIPPWGQAEFFLLPWARVRPFDGRRGQIWSQATIDESAPQYGDNTPVHLAWATRWSLMAGAWDVGLSYFGGTRRDPRFRIADDNEASGVLAPVYDRVHQVGLDAQYTGSSWLWKLEVVTTDPATGRYVSIGSGVEYTPQSYLSLFAEFLFDGQGRLATSSLEHDVFVGSRVFYQEGRITGGAYVDVVTGNIIASFEFTRRFGSNVELGLELRGFMGRAEDEPPHALREEGAVSVFLRHHY